MDGGVAGAKGEGLHGLETLCDVGAIGGGEEVGGVEGVGGGGGGGSCEPGGRSSYMG